MNEDIYNALAGITDELMAARRSWVVLPSGTRINLALVCETHASETVSGKPSLNVYYSGFIYDGGYSTLTQPDDIAALLRAIDARQVQR